MTVQTMRFGIFDHLERRSDVALPQQFEERLQFVELAEAAGFYAYHVAEHHHSRLCLAPNQGVYLAAVAQRTTTLRFGALVHVLPLYHPIRLIEEICMVDQLSDGRYQVGVGPGTGGGTEFALWGGDPAENYARFEETLDILRNGLQNEYLTYQGTYYQFDQLWMELRPRQVPHPPFWWAGRAESAAQRAANYIGASSINGLSDAFATYRSTLASTTYPSHVQPPADPLYGGMKRIYIAETDDEAHERALPAYQAYCDNFADERRFNSAEERARLINPNEHAADSSSRPRSTRVMDPGQAIEQEVILVGSPDTIRDYARRYNTTEANYFVGSFQWGDLTHEEASRSLRLFAQEVMPAFD